MKIQSITIRNFKGIESYQGEIGGKNVYLIGGNAQGKTSFIDAVWCGITGKNIPPEPTTDGAKKGLIEIDLGDFIARTKFSKGKPTRFELENKSFENEADKFVKAPRSFLESKVGVLNFDVNDFFNKTDSEQVKYFAKIMNIDFSHIDADIEELTESRKFDKKKLAELRMKDNYYNKEDAEKELIDLVELSKKITFEKEKKHTYEGVQVKLNEIKSKRGEILAKIEELKKELELVDSKIPDGEEWLSDQDNKPLSEEQFDFLNKQLETAAETNDKIKEAQYLKAVEVEIDVFEKAIETANEDIEKKKVEKAKLISENINIKALEYDVKGERFLYNGLPFDKNQINTAAQLIAGMKIGSMMLKDLKILKVDASLIDKENFDKVLQWSEENDIELFVELVDREATKLEIVLDEGN